MTYAMIPDELPDRLEEFGLSRDDRYLYVELHVYCARLLTDGRIAARIEKVTDHPDPHAAVDRLIAVGLIERTDDALLLPEFLKTNHDRVTVEAMRSNSRARTERHRRHTRGDHSMCDPKRCESAAACHVTSDVTVTVRANGPLSDPIRSDPTRSGEDRSKNGEPSSGRVAASDASPATEHLRHAYEGDGGPCAVCELPAANRRHGGAA